MSFKDIGSFFKNLDDNTFVKTIDVNKWKKIEFETRNVDSFDNNQMFCLTISGFKNKNNYVLINNLNFNSKISNDIFDFPYNRLRGYLTKLSYTTF